MKVLENWDLIDEAGELKHLPAGAYICKIIEATDVVDKQYLDIYFDIVDGEYKGYFTALFENTGKQYGRITRSYKDKGDSEHVVLKFFKAFITAVVKSNPGYTWNWDEKTLNNKLCVVVFRDEEYKVDGVVKVMAKPFEIRSIEALKKGLIKIPPMKKLEPEVAPVVAPIEINDEDLPF